MAREGSHRQGRFRRTLRRCVVGSALALLALGGCVPLAAAATSAVTTTTVNPPAFVPNWDGHTDATTVRYVLTARSLVTVRVFDARGRVVATIDAGAKDTGTHDVAWDGRDSNGRVRAPGRYRVRVDARPLAARPASGQPGGAAMGAPLTVAGARAAVVTVQAPLLAVRGVRLARASLGRSAKASSTTVHFDLTTDAAISAAIADARGRVVRTLAARRMRAGANSLRWNGRAGSGRLLADGQYALVVAATDSGRPTATTRVPVTVDRTLPTVATSRRSRAKASASGVTIPISVRLDEPATVTLGVGRRATKRQLPAGNHALAVPGSELGVGTSRRERTLVVQIRVTDGAGNSVSRAARVTVPAVTRITPAPKPPAPATGGGTLPWPVAGIVTSEFGMRGGRPHQGIDIAAPTGTPIHPAGSGRVSYVGWLSGYGNLVIVEHGGGLRTYSAHMSRFGAFAVGDAVQPTDVIGYVGCTGNCSGPHLHFETRIGDVPQDPRRFLRPG